MEQLTEATRNIGHSSDKIVSIIKTMEDIAFHIENDGILPTLS